jgi:excisionase family DNA binding protein
MTPVIDCQSPTGLLTVPEVAKLLRVCDATVYRLVRRRELSSVRIGWKVLIRPTAVDSLIAKKEHRAIA